MADDLRRTRENLALDLRYAPGMLLQTEHLQWLPTSGTDPGGAALTASYLGDLQLRFVFRSPGLPDSALTAPALAELDLNVQRALAIACLNFKRTHGTPIPTEFAKGVYVLRGVEADGVVNYLLDRVFWRKQLERFPQGVAVAVPKRGNLYFADAADAQALQELKRLAAKQLHTAGSAALSRLLYRFGDTGWQVLGALPEPANVAAPPDAASSRARAQRSESDSDLQDDDERLQLAARGQRLVIGTIVANMVLRGMERTPDVPTWALLALSLVVGVAALVGTVRMCSGLRRVQNEKILFMVMCFVPLLNFLSLIYLSRKTTQLLRGAGWTVGLLGARR